MKRSFGFGKLVVKEPLKIGKRVNGIDLLIVPGIGFDNQGSRIGYGRGYFDEYLRTAKVSFSLGLGDEFQLHSIIYLERL